MLMSMGMGGRCVDVQGYGRLMSRGMGGLCVDVQGYGRTVC